MENEVLQQILNKLTAIEQGQAITNQRLGNLEQGQAKLEQGQAKLEQEQAKTNQRLGNLEQGQTKLEQGQTKLEQGQTKLETEIIRIRESVAIIENDHGKKLGALFDAYSILSDKLEPLPGAIETLQEDVAIIKTVVTSHSKDISALKSAM